MLEQDSSHIIRILFSFATIAIFCFNRSHSPCQNHAEFGTEGRKGREGTELAARTKAVLRSSRFEPFSVHRSGMIDPLSHREFQRNEFGLVGFSWLTI
jgi:hypothetical protein